MSLLSAPLGEVVGTHLMVKEIHDAALPRLRLVRSMRFRVKLTRRVSFNCYFDEKMCEL